MQQGSLSQNYPDLASFRKNMVNKLGSVEVIRQSLYDSAIMPAAGVTTLRMFQSPVGQGLSSSPGNANAVKSLQDTNMTLAGQVPAPQGFWVQSIEVDFQPGSVSTANTFTLQQPGNFLAVPTAAGLPFQGENDVNAFYSGGGLIFTIGTKPYLQEAPLLYFPPKCRFEMDAAIASNSATTGAISKGKLKAGGRPYGLDPGLALMSSQNFDITLQWPAAIAMPSGFNGRVMVKIDGWLFRAVQ